MSRTELHTTIANLKACAADLLEQTPAPSVRLHDVLQLYKSRHNLGINADWAAENIEHGQEYQVFETCDNDRKVSKW